MATGKYNCPTSQVKSTTICKRVERRVFAEIASPNVYSAAEQGDGSGFIVDDSIPNDPLDTGLLRNNDVLHDDDGADTDAEYAPSTTERRSVHETRARMCASTGWNYHECVAIFDVPEVDEDTGAVMAFHQDRTPVITPEYFEYLQTL